MSIRSLFFAAALTVLVATSVEAQQATYTDHWVDEVSLEDPPDNWSTPEYSVGTIDSSYDPYEEYQVELKMYDDGSLVERVWSSWHPTYASVVGTSWIVPDILPTPIANCAEADIWILKQLQNVTERIARTNSETQFQRVESRYGYVGPRGDGKHEYVRDECYTVCHSDRYCHSSGNYLYIRGRGLLARDPATGGLGCVISHKPQNLRPGCQGPTGTPIWSTNGC